MKFLLMMHAADVLSPEDLRHSVPYMVRLAEELFELGELISTEGLASPNQAKVVRATGAGSMEVTDGPYAETKEGLIGYWLVDCESAQRAYEIAARISAVPGPGGAPANMPIEVREVMSAPAGDI